MKGISLFLAAGMAAIVGAAVNEPGREHIMERLYKHLGERRSAGRKLVVGGTNADPTRFPYYAILDVETPAGFFFCGAVLVNDDILLTTAECTTGFTSIFAAVNFTVEAETPTGFEYFREVTNVFVHPEFNATNNRNDLAVLKLELPVNQVAPISIRAQRVGNGVEVTAVGFGELAANTNNFPDILQEVEIVTIPTQDCNARYAGTGVTVLNQRQVCALAPGRDTCNGDAGGPVVMKGATVADDQLVFLTSFGIGCADENRPGIYVRLHHFAQFVDDALCDFSDFRPIFCPSLAPSSSPTITGMPTSPTSSPAPSDSPAPSMSPTRRRTRFCFSGENIVETEQGPMQMDQLKIGDRVLAAGDNYEAVYSFGHYHESMEGEFLQLFTDSTKSPLEVTEDHMVFVQGDRAIPASAVNAGDKLVLANGELTTVNDVKSVVREGAYAPFTKSGTITVNGVKASSFVAFQGEEYMKIAGIETPFSYQWLAHSFESFHRFMSGLGMGSESYNEEGVSNWVYLPLKATQWLLSQNALVIALLMVPWATILFSMFAMEQYPRTMLLLGAFAFVYNRMTVRVNKIKQM
eukprot:CAMPEP_0116559890 /NCGR_PEP_ID=MMETSP0397-20121206/10664_1 /TAXON_ID=216820 /ORGANISM="Cyclophora tenuis, Strain ECT3854" /LENGTH=578 /DNA_ID=CAMNT_0004085743 /DNA_START=41 /DNA_END=1777 /DNA_ORIENTATION=-